MQMGLWVGWGGNARGRGRNANLTGTEVLDDIAVIERPEEVNLHSDILQILLRREGE